MEEIDLNYLRIAVSIARQARAHGNHPFGALLVSNRGQSLLQAENTVITEHDCTCHAEMNLVRLASRRFSPHELADTTLYTSTEPCPMCSGAIYWSGVRRVVYALSARSLYRLTGSNSGLNLPHSRAILDVGGIEVCGPALEDEALSVHVGFWSTPERD
ncbi:MAG: nucleoside deaminase [Chloroflexi bacterium]|nr:nucleoside deaminase [Chloroflexota bacterium]MCL5275250.1 nucleoside deaminase [Chloroflexota bacterium]